MEGGSLYCKRCKEEGLCKGGYSNIVPKKGVKI